MTDTSRNDGDGRAPADRRDETRSANSEDESAPDGGVETTTLGADDTRGPTPDPPEGTVVDDDGGGTNDSAAVAVIVAVGLGFLGPLIAVVGGFGIFAVDWAVGGLPLVANLVLTLIVGQYVAFAGLAIAYLAWRGFDRSRIVSYLGVRWPTPFELGLVVVGWVVILASVLSISFIVQLLGVETAANQSAELAIDNPAIIPLFILASFLVIGPCEEILYRGVVQGRLRERLPAAPSIVIASAVFAFIHVVALTGGVEGRLTTVAILFFPSLVFGAVYEYTENIVVPSLLHGLHNAVIFTILYISVTFADEIEEFAEMAVLPLPF
ncbi:CPBP family intramembrane glutamic endopeptidase [Halorubrum vacuolatum]|uniref:CAAX prenyl protease 2/Lysostaphin resistance protein A-like domain-containing protein n=1 Tax=Halorubrum vacuolatum TaxID=63740 RepID=A0A238VUZ2_HALVU|nr:CPBP family intramembrane glutamic endopeptidase [Halorubrum vacuolatum]SNR37633.1 hypothetical protein SAMN06264855_10462 [Halorubrum vacuolatum]